MKVFIFSLTVFLTVGYACFCQVDTTKKSNNLVDQVDASYHLIQKGDSTKISDSIQKVVLRQQIEDLKSYEKSKTKRA